MVGWRFAPSSLLDTAQQMDRHLTAKNRLEATATLHGSTSLLAQAQREETAAYLSRQPRWRPTGARAALASRGRPSPGPGTSRHAGIMGNTNADAASGGSSCDTAQTTAPGRAESLHHLAIAGTGKQGESHRGSAHGRPRPVDLRPEEPEPGNQRGWRAENEHAAPGHALRQAGQEHPEGIPLHG